MKKKYKVTTIILSICLVITITIGLSFAYYVARVEGAESSATISKTAANLKLTFTDGNGVISAKSIAPGWSASKEFSITNTGNDSADYHLKIGNFVSSYNDNSLSYSYTSANGGASKSKTVIPSGGGDISIPITIAQGATHTYTFYVYYNITSDNQENEMNKSFSFNVNIGAAVTPKVLLSNDVLGDKKVNVGEPVTNVSNPVKVAKEDVESKYSYVNDAEKYITYGTDFTENLDGTVNLTGVTTAKYTDSYASLSGKYLAKSYSYGSGMQSGNVADPTTNLTSVAYVESAYSRNFYYKMTNAKNSEKYLSTTEDDYGTSYYYRGNVDNNYVKFANMCWRIVRITGNGAIKLVLYNENSSKDENPCNSNSIESVITDSGDTIRSYFNDKVGDNAFIGLKYGNNFGCSNGFIASSEVDCSATWSNSSSYALAHNNSINSDILDDLEYWYSNTLSRKSEFNADKLADVIWCNDKSTSDLGYGENASTYGAKTRVTNDTYSLICPNDNNGGKLSKYTTDDTTNGNGDLDYKIGMLTLDETIFAGITPKSTDPISSNYLEVTGFGTYDYWWTLSPAYSGMYNWGESETFVNYFYTVNANKRVTEKMGYETENGYIKIRPSIALKSDVKVSGEGTATNPYIVS